MFTIHLCAAEWAILNSIYTRSPFCFSTGRALPFGFATNICAFYPTPMPHRGNIFRIHLSDLYFNVANPSVHCRFARSERFLLLKFVLQCCQLIYYRPLFDVLSHRFSFLHHHSKNPGYGLRIAMFYFR